MDIPQNLLLLFLMIRCWHGFEGPPKSRKKYINPWIIVKREWNHCCILALFGTRTRTFGWRFEIFSASLLKQWNEWLNHRPDCRHWIKGKFDRKHLWFWCQKAWFPGVSSRFWRLGPMSLVEHLRPSASTSSSSRSTGFGPGCADESRGQMVGSWWPAGRNGKLQP